VVLGSGPFQGQPVGRDKRWLDFALERFRSSILPMPLQWSLDVHTPDDAARLVFSPMGIVQQGLP
jgi:hypothetical protein